ncbi:aldehyde dehydrogenase (NADP(+)) [Sphingobacterium alkalisoli]|uniref:Aldehyde dehydrogenase (NADP(+)) n=1 Tax=Sphingobacterium alkalisoli TaxID=1874115 RepID=A0A4U0GWJ9_9SPHI|nr:aldehyde dehydrogenase (NADP(+)) [Sphingobacterium alkalisoli]TJY63511.1 aldehyde dehydrogenase (NADP(+)) [Sphingobacterium alkalisoli]GGH26537.1 aldehyde dehydrogenase [Sphingobacterium alkalisoli]
MNQPKIRLDEHVRSASEAFQFLKSTTVKERAKFMHAVAHKIESLSPFLLETAHAETALPLARLTGEKARTVGQWRSYANAVEQGIYTEARIDLADAEKGKNDIRKYSIGLGPVVVFGASNFPFAFSTAGGDTASAIGAGCPVLVKGHPAHPQTSQIMADAITDLVQEFGWPKGAFGHILGDHVEGTDTLIGAYLTAHPDVKAVGFTGSYRGGKALFDIANQREEPIPVFAEMGSVNPVFAFSNVLDQRATDLAKEYLASLVMGVGQFCTNPGLFIAVKGAGFERFKGALATAISVVPPARMLNQGIYENFERNRNTLNQQEDVHILSEVLSEQIDGQGCAQVAITTGKSFLKNRLLSEEVFGPFGLLVEAESYEEVFEIAKQLKGQLTATVAGTIDDLQAHRDIIDTIQDKVGRLLFNGMPTGVEVAFAMQHGGPYPSSTDSRFTSVGPDAVKRFVRPIAFQNWPNEFLPEELKNANSLEIMRIVDGVSTAASLKVDID